jgi:hypothetical protein
MPPLSLHFGHRDKLELKAVKDGSASYAALEKKAELYEKLSRGKVPDEEDKEKYYVDFFQKGFDRVYEPQIPECSHRATDGAEPVNDHEDSMPNAKPLGLGQAGTTIDRDEHKRFVRYCFLCAVSALTLLWSYIAWSTFSLNYSIDIEIGVI